MKRLALLLAAVAALLAALAGCGPGVGGTGTGESGEFLADFGAVAKPLCGAAFAPRLDCDGPVRPGEPAPGAGTAAVGYVDVATGGRIVVGFDGNAVTLKERCAGLAFDGVWGEAPGGDARFYGGLQRPGQTLREPASLAVEAVAGSAGGELRITLRAADGRSVLGPVVVRPEPQPPAAAPCP